MDDIVVDRVSQAMEADLEKGVDPFLKRAQEKKERVELNKKQNMANHRRAMKESMSTMSPGTTSSRREPTALTAIIHFTPRYFMPQIFAR